MAKGHKPTGNPVYQRLHNPTVSRFEDAMSSLEGSDHSVSFASGMAAVTAVLLSARMIGSHVVAVRPLYGGTDHLLTSGLLGLDVSWATPDNIQEKIQHNTALILCETPANPTLQLVDIEDVVRQAKGIPVMVDSTFATPVLQRPLEHGAQLVLHSGTKFLGGHGDVMAGVVSCSEEWATRLRQVRILTGGNLHPMAAYTLHRGLQTLGIRVKAAQENARRIARKLYQHPAVEKVMYPEFPGCDPKGVLGRQLYGPGTMIAFEVRGGYEAARGLLGSVELITPAVSLGSVDTLIQHPAGLTHRIVSEEAQQQSGIGPGLIRLSVGLEDVEDLWSDLSNALYQSDYQLAMTAK
jgi:cystathionine beta-lyase/cystathionine gamma-synthase